MALVKLMSNWFAPSDPVRMDNKGILQASGLNFTKTPSGAWTEIPDELVPYLPKDAVVKDEVEKLEKSAEKIPQLSFKDFDHERAASDALVKATEQAEKNKK